MGIDMGIDKRCKKKLESIKAISLKLVCAGVILRHMREKKCHMQRLERFRLEAETIRQMFINEKENVSYAAYFQNRKIDSCAVYCGEDEIQNKKFHLLDELILCIKETVGVSCIINDYLHEEYYKGIPVHTVKEFNRMASRETDAVIITDILKHTRMEKMLRTKGGYNGQILSVQDVIFFIDQKR